VNRKLSLDRRTDSILPAIQTPFVATDKVAVRGQV